VTLIGEDRAAVEDGEEQSLRYDAARAVRDNGLAQVVAQLLRVSGFIILARTLLPSDFGVLRVLTVIWMFAALLGEGGIPDALVQRKSLSAEHEASGFCATMGFSVAVALTLFFAARPLSVAMQMPQLAWGIRLLCIPVFLEGTALMSAVRLRRELRFGPLATADVISEAGFFAAALVLLALGLPRWSLAGGLCMRYVTHALTIWVLAGRVSPLNPKLSAVRDLGRFSASVSGGRLLSVFSANADYLIVGKLLGSSALGFYSMAWDLLRFVPDRIYLVVGRVALPAFCRLQDRDESLRSAYVALIGYMSRIMLPIAAVSMVAGRELIVGVYGAKWMGTAVPFQLLAFGLAAVGLRSAVGTIYYAKDHPEFDIYLHGARLVMVVMTVVSLAPFGLWPVSLGMSLAEAMVGVAAQVMVCVLVGLRPIDLLAAMGGGLKSAACCTVAAKAGAFTAARLGMGGAFTVPFVVIPVALVLVWLEFGTASKAVRLIFGLQTSSLVGATQEQT
jgi:PST family polysaccharide transporter